MNNMVLKSWAYLLAASLLALTVGASPVSAKGASKGLASADAKAIRVVIEAQLDAFARDDADQAFAYAAAPIRAMFGSPANFLRMVKTGYPVIYRPLSVTFLKPEVIDGDTLQSVQMSDQDGQVWVAHYHMQRQKNRSWLINGCQLEKSSARVT